MNHDAQIQSLKNSLDGLISAGQLPDVEAAQNACKIALALAPDDPILREHFAILEQSSGNLADATMNARRAVQLLPSSPENWSQLGTILAKQQDYEDAASAFRHAFQLNPEDVWALQYRAQSLRHLGRRDEAIQEFQHALAVKSRFGPAWFGLGQILEEMGHKTEAENCYHKALLKQNRVELAPELELLAKFCTGRGWNEAAADNFDTAIKLNPSDATLFLEAGQSLARLKRHTEAEHYYAEAAKLSPDSVQARFFYDLELGRDGRFADAAAQFREAVRIRPNMPEARMNLGVALAKEGNYSEALEQFDKAFKQNPTNATALNYLRDLHQKLSATRVH